MRSLLRAIDANANRAREALRVMEDVARFAIDRVDLCTNLKRLRHDLAAALEMLPSNPIIVRDAASDVGTRIYTTAEGERAGAGGVAVAAGKRLTEALRSLEEHAKAIESTDFAMRIEQLRYRAYDLERELVLALGSNRRRQWKLCVIITESVCKHPWLEVARAALAGCADSIQLREKDITDRELIERARVLRSVTREQGAALIINDRPDIAVLCDADGVHLGQTDMPISAARRIVGLERLIGASATTMEQAHAAARAGADYIGLGPMFQTMTKQIPGGRSDGSLAGPELVRSYLARDVALPPHLAIGGISPENIGALVEVGCRGIAICAAICAAADPGAAARQVLAALCQVDAGTVAHT